MKNILYSILISLLFVFASCEKSSDDMSKVTYFVSLELKGAEKMIIKKGEAYVEPGVVAMEGQDDISSSIIIDGTVNTNKVGLYTLKYSAKNKDGFAKSIERTVIVYNPDITTDISGTYTVVAGSYRQMGEAKTDFSGYAVEFAKVTPGIFEVSDLLGGYYDKKQNYGSDYAMSGLIALNEDNTITVLSGFVPAWGDSFDRVDNAKLDPLTGAISWELAYAGQMNFYITVNK